MSNGVLQAAAPPGSATASVDARMRLRAPLEIAISLALAAAVSAPSIRQSIAAGRLSAPPMYDDVVYLVAARRWILRLHEAPIGESIRALFDQHAPISTWLGIVGFYASGGSVVGPYVMNSVPLAVYFLGLLWMLRGLPLAAAAAGVMLAASVPFLSHAITEFRPDLIQGMIAGFCAVTLVHRQILGRGRASQLLLGLLVGTAILAKPSACVATVALLGWAFAVRVILDKRSDAELRWPRFFARSASAAGWVLLGAAVVAGPTFAIRYAQIFGYIYQTLVTGRDFWALDASLIDHARFYATGTGGRLALGAAFWVMLATFAVRTVVAIWRDPSDRLPLAALIAVVVVAYAIPTATVVKTYFLGGMFYSTLLTAGCANGLAILRAWSVPPGWERLRRQALLLVVACCAGWAVDRLYLRPVGLATGLPAQLAENYRTATDRVWAVVRERARAGNADGTARAPLRVAFNSPDPANPTAMELYALQERTPIAVGAFYFERRIEDTVARLPQWNIVVVSSSIPHQLPGPRNGDDLIRILDARDDFALVASFAQVTQGVVRIYERRRP